MIIVQIVAVVSQKNVFLMTMRWKKEKEAFETK
jgi:hypothetical protein